ncbi:MAG TPA: hypothetical protein VNI20_12505, partial [Fimbriimonadaceae bacterium]|nr:hypothetical protein [Fimbriimonadaceae bacterium]
QATREGINADKPAQEKPPVNPKLFWSVMLILLPSLLARRLMTYILNKLNPASGTGALRVSLIWK